MRTTFLSIGLHSPDFHHHPPTHPPSLPFLSGLLSGVEGNYHGDHITLVWRIAFLFSFKIVPGEAMLTDINLQ